MGAMCQARARAFVQDFDEPGDVELRLDTTRSDDLNDLEGSGEVER